MDEEIKLFYNELRKIQDLTIGMSLSKVNFYEKTEDMLEDITYNTIYKICELLDGYRNELIKYKLINAKSNYIVNDGFELHDWCEEFLRCTDI